ncbi:MAG: ABC transporter ATP-binding protein [Eubacterium sp.]|nr:ABC transporter ATP-binding protein [Eubacterium sp.]
MKNKSGLLWIIRNNKKEIPKIVFLSISYMILALVTTSLAVMTKKAIDAAADIAKLAKTHKLTGNISDFKEILFYCGIILAIIVGRLLLRLLAQSVSIRVQARINMKMRAKLFTQIMAKDYSKINEYHSGELMNRMTSDITIISDGVTSIVPDMLYYITQFIGAFVVLIVFDWRFTLLFLLVGIIVSLVTLLFRGKFKHLHKEVQSTDGVVRSFFQEAIESLLVVKTFRAEDKFAKKGDELQEVNFDAKMKKRRLTILANAGFSFVFNFGYLFALVWCAIKVASSAMTFGTLTAVLQLVGQIQTPFVNITKVVPQYYSIIASAERIMEIEQIDVEETEEAIDGHKFYDKFDKASFENIKFNYGRESVLEQGDAEFAKGDFVAIRGISGIGKSTLMKMLLGVFKPQSGAIKLYETDGSYVDASPDTRSLFSYVPQGNYLFSGTLRENILLINPNATDEQIDEALRISDIYDFVHSLPDGLDTVIGEKGQGISEGQAQRLAIARALISEAPIILLDEATSALDAQTEKRVLDNIKSLGEKTCIIITHKNAALDVCNKEFVIEDKKLSCIGGTNG